ncbi:MAG: MFS transporter [Muribaculaceae bacterium]|nr:MFS transporter [Muribaculaceae bacterium]
MFHIKSGYGNNTLPLWAVFNLYVIFICTSLPGLAISPIMGDLTKIFPGTSALESQFLSIGPNLAAIPFVFLGGWIGTKFNNNKLTFWTCLFYGICGVLFFFVPNMITLIILSFLIGIAAGILSPLASAFIADMFQGKQRTAQYGYTSATLNLVLMGCVIATGYLAKINWRLPFVVYLLPIVPLFFAKGFGKYIKEPSQLRKADTATAGKPVHYKFSEQVNMPMLIRYCAYYFFITLVIAAISLYIPFRYSNSATAGDLTSVLFFGIMISGYTLNYVLKIMKNKVAIICILFIVAGFALMTFWSEVFVVGLGILIATYFYGVAQPYYYNKLSVASSRIALTLTLAWFASMDSIGNVVAPFIIDGIAKVFHTSTQTHPIVAFRICLWMTVIAAALVIVRKIYVEIRNKNREDKEKDAVAEAKPAIEAKADTAVKSVAAEPAKAVETVKENADKAAQTVKDVVDDKAKAASESTNTK